VPAVSPGLNPLAGTEARGIPNAVDFPPFTVPAELCEAAEPRGVFLLLPAMGTPARYYRPFAEASAALGFHCVVPELPGSGSSGPRPSRKLDYGYRDLVDRWAVPLVRLLRERYGRLPLVLLGHSLGAQVGMLATLQNRLDADALVTLAGGHIYWRHWEEEGAWRVRFVAWLVTGASYLLGYVPGQHLGLGGPQARTLMREWGWVIRTGRFDHVSDRLESAAAIPSLCLGYEGDFMAPGKSVAALAKLLGGTTEQMTVDWPGNPHASWARNPAPTLERVEEWLVARGVVSEAWEEVS